MNNLKSEMPSEIASDKDTIQRYCPSQHIPRFQFIAQISLSEDGEYERRNTSFIPYISKVEHLFRIL